MGDNENSNSSSNEPLRGEFGTIIPEGFPPEFCDEGEPRSGIVARHALAWMATEAPALLPRYARAARGGDDDVPDPLLLDVRARLADRLVKLARWCLRHAGDMASEAHRLAATPLDGGDAAEVYARALADDINRAARASYFARWIAAAVAWDRAEMAACAAEAEARTAA